jgi:hypothetical protein
MYLFVLKIITLNAPLSPYPVNATQPINITLKYTPNITIIDTEHEE